MEEKRRERQYNKVLSSFRDNIKQGNGHTLVFHAIMYDEVRTRLENDGFSVVVKKTSSGDNLAYYITYKGKESLSINYECSNRNLG